MTGTTHVDSAPITIPADQIANVGRRERSVAKTALLVVGATVGVVAFLYMLGAALTPSAGSALLFSAP